MSEINRHFVAIVLEWGKDYDPVGWRKVEEIRLGRGKYPEGWHLPTPKEFEDANKAGVLGFVSPTTRYWAAGKGDALAIIPVIPTEYYVCNRYDIQHRVRLVRCVHIFTNSFKTKTVDSQVESSNLILEFKD
ncbi:MAG: hypothetical protein V4524_00185 [Patescibacteria group bacterium]